jgi:hypothetical protein
MIARQIKVRVPFIPKTAVKPQRAQRTGSKTKVYSINMPHLLGDYSVFSFSFKYEDVFFVSSVVNAFLRFM